MLGLGFTEVVVILLLILLVFGPARLPEIAKGIGKGMRQIRRATKDLDAVPEIREIRKAVDEIRTPVIDTLREPILDPDEEPPPPPKSPLATGPGGSVPNSDPNLPKKPVAVSADKAGGSSDGGAPRESTSAAAKDSAAPASQQKDSAPPPPATPPKPPDSKS